MTANVLIISGLLSSSLNEGCFELLPFPLERDGLSKAISNQILVEINSRKIATEIIHTFAGAETQHYKISLERGIGIRAWIKTVKYDLYCHYIAIMPKEWSISSAKIVSSDIDNVCTDLPIIFPWPNNDPLDTDILLACEDAILKNFGQANQIHIFQYSY